MSKNTYEVLTDNYPRRNPIGKGKSVELTAFEAKYLIMSGDLKLTKLASNEAEIVSTPSSPTPSTSIKKKK